ncbi:MAG: hypothetical protein ACYCSF_09170 [Acidimicrobiales bacterium]
MGETSTCTAVREAAAEIALGVLLGSERAHALAHLEICPPCAAEVRGFAAAADTLFQLAPRTEPPAGFEVRLLARRALQERDGEVEGRSPSRVPTRLGSARASSGLRVSAAAVILAAGIGIGALVFARSGSGHPASVRTAELSSHGIVRGNVAVAFGHPSWMFMTVEDPGWSGWVRCVLTERGHREVTVGRFVLDSGYGAWAVRLTMPLDAVQGARLELDDGTTIAAASFPAQ